MRIIAGLLLALLCVHAHAEAGVQNLDILRRNVQFEQLSTEDGLSHEMVYRVAQDGAGFIWIATQEGLNRFDGHSVRRFGHLRTDPATLSSDFVRTLFVDRHGMLWVGTEAGVDRHLGHGLGFARDPFEGMDTRESLGRSVRAIAQSSDGSYWFGTAGGGLVHVDPATRSLKSRVVHERGDGAPDTIQALLVDSRDQLWIGTDGAGVFVTGGLDSEIDAVPGTDALATASVRAITEDREGRIWIGTDDAGVVRVDPASGAVRQWRHDAKTANSLPADRVRDVFEDRAGTLWVATDAGLAEWRGPEAGFVTYRHDDRDARSLASDRVNSLFEDTSGVLWIGTWRGVSRWNYLSDVFTWFTAADGQLPGDIVTSMAETSTGRLWVGTYGTGLASLDADSSSARFYARDADDPGSLPDDRVMTVHVDEGDRLWLGTRAAGLARLETSSDAFRRFAHDPDDDTSISGNAITTIHTGPDGALWVGTFGAGLNRMRPDADGVFDRFAHATDDPASLSGDRVLALASTTDGRLWVGTEGAGLNRLDPASGRAERFARFTVVAEEGESLEPGSITDLLQDSRGTLWIATLGQGLLRWNSTDLSADVPRVAVFDQSTGMPSDAIYGLVEDTEGAIWASSNRGLTRIDPSTAQLRQFDARNGLRESELNQGARLGTRSGELLFGGIAGMVRFRPDDLPFNEREPRIVVTASSRDAELVTAEPGEPAPLVEIGYLDPFLAFDFVALDFVSPDKNQYRYRLEGFDPDWIDARGFRRAIYSNIPAGRYSFAVQATNNDGVWGSETGRIEVLAVPAPWNSLPAYALYMMTALFAAGFYLRTQREKLAQESRQRLLLEELVEQRTHQLAESNQNLHKLNERLEEAAVTDSLTGLRNRRYADQFIANDISKFERDQLRLAEQARERGDPRPERSMFFMMLDLDGFKAINDQFGHHAGDQALLQIRDILLNACRASDTIIRWGGDEFLVVGTTTEYGHVKVLAERIRDAVARHRFVVSGDREARLSASIGISPYPLVPDRYSFCSWELVSAVADEAAYIAKGSGRNAWVSLVGTESLSPDALTGGLSSRIGDLIAGGDLVLETSLEGELRRVGGERLQPPDRP